MKLKLNIIMNELRAREYLGIKRYGVKPILVLVKIYYFSVFGKGSISLTLDDNASVQDALKSLDVQFSESFKKETRNSLMEAFNGFFNVFLNSERLSLPSEYPKKLNKNDRFIICRPISGG